MSTHRTHDRLDEQLPVGALLLAFVAIAALIGVDLVIDFHHGGSLSHLLGEGLIMVTAGVGATLLWRDRRRARQRAARLSAEVADARAQADALRVQNEQWRADSQVWRRGLRETIDAQFERWGLSVAEAEVALLLLKGLSLKEVAGVRETSERTARQQALSVYRKGNLTGRADLSAFFLEDLFEANV